MTSAVDLLDKHWAEFVGKPMDEVTKHHLYYCIEAIQEAQKEAYNEAINDVAKNVKMTYRMPVYGEDQACMYPYEVDKNSIINLLKP